MKDVSIKDDNHEQFKISSKNIYILMKEHKLEENILIVSN